VTISGRKPSKPTSRNFTEDKGIFFFLVLAKARIALPINVDPKRLMVGTLSRHVYFGGTDPVSQ
jgi:hypothetical protein